MLNRVPKEIDISEMMIVRAISGHVEKIGEGLKDVLESMAAETAAVLLDREIILTGRGRAIDRPANSSRGKNRTALQSFF